MKKSDLKDIANQMIATTLNAFDSTAFSLGGNKGDGVNHNISYEDVEYILNYISEVGYNHQLKVKDKYMPNCSTYSMIAYKQDKDK
jgi:hypothetical protein